MASHCSPAALPTIPATIYEQIGGARCFAILGAYNAVYDTRYLMFMIRGCRKFNKIQIELTPDDLYTMHFYRIDKYGCITRGEAAGRVYADQLRDIIEEKTGLYTSIGAIKRV